jgi:hypothetical protein
MITDNVPQALNIDTHEAFIFQLHFFEFCHMVLVICYFPDEPVFSLHSNRFIRISSFEI